MLNSPKGKQSKIFSKILNANVKSKIDDKLKAKLVDETIAKEAALVELARIKSQLSAAQKELKEIKSSRKEDAATLLLPPKPAIKKLNMPNTSSLSSMLAEEKLAIPTEMMHSFVSVPGSVTKAGEIVSVVASTTEISCNSNERMEEEARYYAGRVADKAVTPDILREIENQDGIDNFDTANLTMRNESENDASHTSTTLASTPVDIQLSSMKEELKSMGAFLEAWKGLNREDMSKLMKNMIQEYFQFYDYSTTLECFQAESVSKSFDSAAVTDLSTDEELQLHIARTILRAFEDGDSRLLWHMWEQHIPLGVRHIDAEAKRFEFLLYVHFAALPIRRGVSNMDQMKRLKVRSKLLENSN